MPSVRFIEPNIPAGMYGVAALAMVTQLVRVLERNGTVSADERRAVYRGTHEAIQPGHVEPMRSLRALLTALEADKSLS